MRINKLQVEGRRRKHHHHTDQIICSFIKAQENIFKMLKTTSLLSRRFLLSSAASAGQDVKQMATASELARQRRSLQGRVAVVTASTDGSVLNFLD